MQVRQLLLKQEQEKVRVLEEALHVLAREHHDLEKSVANSVPYYHSPPRSQSVCMSDTDVDEYFDAFDEGDDSKSDDKTVTAGSECSLATHTLTAEYLTPQSSWCDIREKHPDNQVSRRGFR